MISGRMMRVGGSHHTALALRALAEERKCHHRRSAVYRGTGCQAVFRKPVTAGAPAG
jgi:hypothetical protein